MQAAAAASAAAISLSRHTQRAQERSAAGMNACTAAAVAA